MASRAGFPFWIALALASFAILIPGAGAAGTGAQGDPFRVHELTMDARFVSEGIGRLQLNSNLPLTSSRGEIAQSDNRPLVEGRNIISIHSDSGNQDLCDFSKDYDHVLAAFRIGSDTDGNIIYTQADGWVAALERYIDEADLSACSFSGPGSQGIYIDLPWTLNEKCVNTPLSPCTVKCCPNTTLSRTFYVRLCSCSSGACCDGCEFTPGASCGESACPQDYYLKDISNCYRYDYPVSCTRACDASGACQTCTCNPAKTQEPWDCPYPCQQKNLSSCTGTIGPSCEPSPSSTSCGTKDCSSYNRYVKDPSGNCYYRNYSSCTKYCSGGYCADCACSAYSDAPVAWTCGTCKQRDPYSCQGNTGPLCTNLAPGTYCTTSLSQPGTCDGYGNCIPKPSLQVLASLSSASIRVGQSATLAGSVQCLNAVCGDVHLYVKDALTGLSYFTGLEIGGGNPQTCQAMADGSTCTKSWSLKGINPGSYLMHVLATNSSMTNQSANLNLQVREIPAGQIALSVQLSPSSIATGASAKMAANITCSGYEAYCGNVTASLLVYPTSGISIQSSNPQYCLNLWNGTVCYREWMLSAGSPGSYNISVSAISDRPGVTGAGDYRILSVNEKAIQVAGVQLSPGSIRTGEKARLNGTIRCLSSDAATVSCGRVRSYARYNGNRITQSGPLSVQSPDVDCGIMYSAPPYDACNVSWEITGIQAGSYLIDILAYSDSAEIRNATSEARTLDVSKNLGSLSIPKAELNPPKIDLRSSTTNSTALSAIINCSSSYCGAVVAALYSGGVLLGPATPVSTQQNQQSCASFPCALQWTLRSSQEGSYPINISATSNESMQASNTTFLVVQGYNPLLSLSPAIPASVTAGQAAQIKANISCFTKDCGQVTASLSYSEGGWKLIPYGGVYLSSGTNPEQMSLSAGQSREVQWDVIFSRPGAYLIGIFAAGTAPNIVNANRTGSVAASAGMSSIEVLSPKENQAFFRGDTISMAARITRDGMPALGLKPLANVQNLLSASLYDDGTHDDSYSSDGIYGGHAEIPSGSAEGQYTLFISDGESSDSVQVSVSSGLQASLATDRSSYSWGDSMTLSGYVKKGNAGAQANLTAGIACGDYTGYVSFATGPDGSYSHAYSLTFVPSAGCRMAINITADDGRGNRGFSSAEVPVTGYEGDLLNLSFSMESYSFKRGKQARIAVKATEMGAEKEGLRVMCNFLGSNIELLEEGAGVYYRDYLIPLSAPLWKQSLSCSVTEPKPGVASAVINIEPTQLKITVLSPEPFNNVLAVVSDQPVDLKVAIFYADGQDTPVKDAVVQMKVGNETKNLTYTGIPGIYNASGVIFRKDRPGPAVSSMFLQALDLQGNFGENNITISVDTGELNIWWLLLIPAGVIIMLVAFLYMKSREPPKVEIHEKIIRLPVRERVREVVYRPVRVPEQPRPRPSIADMQKEELRRMEERYRTLQNAKDLAEQQYYKRQIDESTFNKLMQKYEEKLIETDAAIRQKRKELEERDF